MNIQELNEKKACFQSKLNQVYKVRKTFYSLRREFVSKFPVKDILGMDKNNYVAGRTKIDGIETFCYWLEVKLDALGTIGGSPPYQFGVYYGHYMKSEDRNYRFIKRWGDNFQDAFQGVKQEISSLLEAGNKEDLISIENNILPAKFKGKLLSTYYPDRYLNIFSNDYLNDILIHFNLDIDNIIQEEPIIKQEKLLLFKNNDSSMSKWSIDEFSVFLNEEMETNYYAKKKLVNTSLEDYTLPNYPPIEELEITGINFTIDKREPFSNDDDKRNLSSTDYIKKARLLKNIGDRAESIVIKYEKDFLTKNGKSHWVKYVQLQKNDYEGYDVISRNLDGKTKYIEVKATRAPVGKAEFYFTKNEKAKAESLENYHLYIVYGVKSRAPQIWDLGNLFNPANKFAVVTPINYFVEIN